METYKNLSNQEGEILYEIGFNSITLVFKKNKYDSGTLYHYSTKLMSKENIEMMCQLAANGRGLRTYLHSKRTRSFVKHDYKKDLTKE